mgnify:CR=1 FL=1
MRAFYATVIVVSAAATLAAALTMEEMKAKIDSLETTQRAAERKRDTLEVKKDSLNAVVVRKYRELGLLDSIAAQVEESGAVHEQPDVVSLKLFQIQAGDTVVVVDFAGEWFKVLHRQGTGFVLEECIEHDERIGNYRAARADSGRAHGPGGD